ncbi:response regulator [Prosthecobacter sp.]|uniref:hybrid sensor histidine kinase/response regulator n=1 Tax=Prosthecobacter sp. TaxID=1965333 RepID=UPI0037841BAC
MAGAHSTATLLLVDDDPGLTRLIARALEREGYQTHCTGSAQEAAEWLAKNQADLLLLDLKLPDGEGSEVITAVAETGRSVPFVVITGQGDERVAVDMMKRGALDYLVKDAHFLEFLPTVVRRALAQVEKDKQLAAAEAELRTSNEVLRGEIAKRRELEREILYVSEREQQRIGQDLHDDLGQRLAGTWLMSDVLKKSLKRRGLPEAEHAAQINSLLKEALVLTRTLARGLHPVTIGDGGLAAALEELAVRTRQMFSITCAYHGPAEIALDNTTATHLYRISQEAVTNAVKHGKAKSITIEVSLTPGHYVLSIRNDGSLLPGSAAGEGMGLRTMKYRADMIGGMLELQNRPDRQGTMVVCTLPATSRVEDECQI